jgi:hypothetical protein
MKFFKIFLSCLLGSMVLVGCGGGGAAAPEAPLTSAQGFWSGTVTGNPDGATSVSAVITPAQSAWVVLLNGSTPIALVNANLSTTTTMGGSQASATGTGSYFKLGTTVRQNITVTGVATRSNTFSGTATLATTPLTSFTWTSNGNAAYSTPATTTDLVASWSGSTDGGSVTVTWSVNSSGTVTGSSTTGCTYAGSIAPIASVAVYSMAVAETCGAAVENLSGIATLNASKSILSIAYTAAAGTKGNLLQLQRP